MTGVAAVHIIPHLPPEPAGPTRLMSL